MPDQVWTKIEEFQKKGSAQNFAQGIQAGESLKQVNADMLAQCQKTLDDEESEDSAYRTQHGSKFNRPPSATVNQQYKNSLTEYKQKMDMAVATDT